MTYVFNAMSSIPVSAFIIAIVDEYISNIVISIGSTSATLRVCTKDNVLVPGTITVNNELIYTSTDINNCEGDIAEGLIPGYKVEEFHKIRKKLISKIKKTYPKGVDEIFTTLKEGDAIYDYREFDYITGKDISGFLDTDVPLKFARMSLYPETLDELIPDAHVLNIVRNPVVDYVVNIRPGIQDNSPWPRVDNVPHTLVEDMILSLLYKEWDTKGKSTTFRYEDTFLRTDIKILDKTINIPLSGVNSYLSVYDVSAVKDADIIHRITMVPAVEKMIALDNYLKDNIQESKNNITKRKATNLKRMKQILTVLEGDVICPPLVYMELKDFDLYNKVSVPLYDKYSRVHDKLKGFKDTGLTYNTIFRYPTVKDVRELIQF